MNINHYFKKLIYFLILYTLVYLFSAYLYQLEIILKGKNLFHYYYLISFISMTFIGIYLSIPRILKEYKKIGKWKIDYFNLLVVGLPFLLISLFRFYYINFSFKINVINLLLLRSMEHELIYFSTNIILGFIIGSSIKKYNTLNKQ